MDILTIGDALVSFNPLSSGPLRFAHTFERKVGGAELNVAIGCSRLGLRSSWISRLGNDEFGRYIYNFARSEGIDVSQVNLVEGYPTSIYFKEFLNEENINSYYYRYQSPTLALKGEEIDESYVKQFKVLHITGVFPAINDTNKETLLHLLKVAKKNNLTVTLDPNIRLKLWNAEDARNTLLSYLPYVDILIAGEEELELLFNTSNFDLVIEASKRYDIHHVVMKLGEKGAVGYNNGEIIHAPIDKPVKVVDVIGAGDAFASGYLYSLLQKWTLSESLSFANAVAGRVIGIKGDNEGLPTKEEMDIFLGDKLSISR